MSFYLFSILSITTTILSSPSSHVKHIVCAHYLINPLDNLGQHTPIIFPLFAIKEDEGNVSIQSLKLFVWNRNPKIGDNGNVKYHDTLYETQEELIHHIEKVRNNIDNYIDFGTSYIHSFDSDELDTKTTSTYILKPILIDDNVFKFAQNEYGEEIGYIYGLFVIGNCLENFVYKYTNTEEDGYRVGMDRILIYSHGQKVYKIRKVENMSCFLIDNETSYNSIVDDLVNITKTKVLRLKEDIGDRKRMRVLKMEMTSDFVENIKVKKDKLAYKIGIYENEKEISVSINDYFRREIRIQRLEYDKRKIEFFISFTLALMAMLFYIALNIYINIPNK